MFCVVMIMSFIVGVIIVLKCMVNMLSVFVVGKFLWLIIVGIVVINVVIFMVLKKLFYIEMIYSVNIDGLEIKLFRVSIKNLVLYKKWVNKINLWWLKWFVSIFLYIKLINMLILFIVMVIFICMVELVSLWIWIGMVINNIFNVKMDIICVIKMVWKCWLVFNRLKLIMIEGLFIIRII